MTGTLAYGGYVFMQPATTSKQTLNAVANKNNYRTLDDLLRTTTQELNKSNLSTTDTRIIARAEAPWPRADLFRPEAVGDENKGEAKTTSLADKYIYSGFVEVGDKIMAIINGQEYKTGDVVDLDGFIVQAISPTRLILEGNKRASEDSGLAEPEKIVITVPLAE